MAPDATTKTVQDCLADDYGLEGKLERLAGENLNYLLTTRQGQKYVVKIVDDDMPSEVVEMEFEAMEYAISAGFSLKLPEIIQNIYMKNETGIIIHTNDLYSLRILGFIDGILLENITDISTKLLKNVGFALARYNLAMQGFDHPAAHRSHRWNLVEASRHRDKIKQVEDPKNRALMEWGFDVFRTVESDFETLPWQFIHGDMNRENILVNGDRVSGLVDFGDSCWNPAICDLAICLTYMMMDQPDPLETVVIVTRAYNEIRPIHEAEFVFLMPLICGRLAMSNAIAAARRSIDPDNPNWFGGEDSAWAMLELLRRPASQAFFAQLKSCV